MRVEKQHGNWIVCGHIFPLRNLHVGQLWQSSTGVVVEIKAVEDGEITYAGGVQPLHTKSAFDFQCRYSMIVDEPEVCAA